MISSLENSEDIYLEADVCISNKYPSYIFTFFSDHLNDGQSPHSYANSRMVRDFKGYFPIIESQTLVMVSALYKISTPESVFK